MSMKKSNTKKARKSSAPKEHGRVWMQSELAAHIAAVIEHPYTPTTLYNAITEAICELDSEIPSKDSTDTAEYIERILNYGQGFGYCNIGRYERVRQPDGRVFTIPIKVSPAKKGGTRLNG